MDILRALDLETAAANVHADILGDWYHDAWKWPETEWLATQTTGQAVLTKEWARSAIFQAARIDVPKENFGTRPAVVMNPVDRLIYQACVDRLSKKLIGDLYRDAFGWRLDRTTPEGGSYAKNTAEYTLFRRRLSALAQEHRCLLTTDITGCFASMPVKRIGEAIEQRCGDNEITRKTRHLLLSFSEIPGRRGLLQRSLASCVIANSYLRTLDEALDRESGGKYARWMDDIYVFGSSWSQLRRIQLRASDVMRELELEMNISKTAIFEGDEMRARIDQVEASGVAKALFHDDDDDPLLERVQQEIVDKVEAAERTTVSHACALATERGVEAVARLLVDVADRLPQAADHLADLFRHFELGREMQDWFLAFQASDWGEQHWAVAHLAAILPPDLPPSDQLVTRFAEMLNARSATRAQLPTTKITALRLCLWNEKHRLDILRNALDRTVHPQEIRVLALLAAAAGEERFQVRKWLGTYPDNTATLAMLEETNFKLPAIAKLA